MLSNKLCCYATIKNETDPSTTVINLSMNVSETDVLLVSICLNFANKSSMRNPHKNRYRYVSTRYMQVQTQIHYFARLLRRVAVLNFSNNFVTQKFDLINAFSGGETNIRFLIYIFSGGNSANTYFFSTLHSLLQRTFSSAIFTGGAKNYIHTYLCLYILSIIYFITLYIHTKQIFCVTLFLET